MHIRASLQLEHNSFISAIYDRGGHGCFLGKNREVKYNTILSAPLLLKDDYTKVIEERKRQAEEDRIKKEEADQKKKEEQEKKKKEAEEKKKEDEEKKKAEAAEQEKNVKKKDIHTRLKEAYWSTMDAVLKPIEDHMDSVVGTTIDPFTDRRYIAWLSLVTVAINYNIWFVTARLCFPYHNESANPQWLAMDLLADFVYFVDTIIFQPRKQFVKGGDIIVSLK